jgi:hypothetical protein
MTDSGSSSGGVNVLVRIKTDLDKALEGPTFEKCFSPLEKKTGISRHYIIYALGVMIVLLVTYGYLDVLLTSVIGFGYPCLATLRLLHMISTKNDTKLSLGEHQQLMQWLFYWLIFAAFSVLENVAFVFLRWMPFYFIFKLFLLVWCFLPQTQGALVLYEQFRRMAGDEQNTNNLHAAIDQVAEKVKEVVDKENVAVIAKRASIAIRQLGEGVGEFCEELKKNK